MEYCSIDIDLTFRKYGYSRSKYRMKIVSMKFCDSIDTDEKLVNQKISKDEQDDRRLNRRSNEANDTVSRCRHSV